MEVNQAPSSSALAGGATFRERQTQRSGLLATDSTDVVAFLRRQEIRNRLASLDDKTRHEFVSKHATTNPDVGMAILEMLPEFTKVAGTHELERAIEVANSAVEVALGEPMHEAGVFNPRAWDEKTKDIKPAAYTHWLKKMNGEIKVLKPNGTGFTAPTATEEEIASGRFFRNVDEYKAANAA